MKHMHHLNHSTWLLFKSGSSRTNKDRHIYQFPKFDLLIFIHGILLIKLYIWRHDIFFNQCHNGIRLSLREFRIQFEKENFIQIKLKCFLQEWYLENDLCIALILILRELDNNDKNNAEGLGRMHMATWLSLYLYTRLSYTNYFVVT